MVVIGWIKYIVVVWVVVVRECYWVCRGVNGRLYCEVDEGECECFAYV